MTSRETPSFRSATIVCIVLSSSRGSSSSSRCSLAGALSCPIVTSLTRSPESRRRDLQDQFLITLSIRDLSGGLGGTALKWRELSGRELLVRGRDCRCQVGSHYFAHERCGGTAALCRSCEVREESSSSVRDSNGWAVWFEDARIQS